MLKGWIWKFCDFDRNGGKIYSCPLLPKTIFARIASLTPAGCCSRPAAGKCSSSQALTPDPSPGPWWAAAPSCCLPANSITDVCHRSANVWPRSKVLRLVPAAPSSALLPQLLDPHQQERLRDFSRLQALGFANRGKGNLSKFFIVPNFLEVIAKQIMKVEVNVGLFLPQQSSNGYLTCLSNTSNLSFVDF